VASNEIKYLDPRTSSLEDAFEAINSLSDGYINDIMMDRASLYTYENSVQETLATAGTYYQITGLTDGTQAKLATNTNDEITISDSALGPAHVSFHATVKADKACILQFDVFVTPSGGAAAATEQISCKIDIQVAAKWYTVSAGDLIEIEVGDKIDIRAKSTQNTTVMDVDHLNLVVIQESGKLVE
jgi:hypothetical protein